MTGAHLLAVDARTGQLRWRTQLDAHPTAVLTQSPAVVDGTVYWGNGYARIPPGTPSTTFYAFSIR